MMHIQSAEFIKSAAKSAQYPPAGLPEIAFVGRSNVGKSSVINTLVKRKRLVKTSSTPGRTQLINFFKINDAFVFVDLPGFGYAKVPSAVRRTWQPMIETYLLNRESLVAVVVIMDIRRMPDQKEKNLLDWMAHHGLRRVLILTKTDKFSKSRLIHQHRVIAKALGVTENELNLFSAKTRRGRQAVLDILQGLVDQYLSLEF